MDTGIICQGCGTTVCTCPKKDQVYGKVIDELEAEIETLRNKFEIECAAHERTLQNRDEWKRRAAAEKLANTILVKASEEWERRFSMLRNEVREVEINYFLANHPEAAEWFKTE